MWVIMECLLIGSAMKPKSLKEGAIRRVCVCVRYCGHWAQEEAFCCAILFT